LLERLAADVENPTTIEICVTSNLLTKAVDCLENHPVRKFYDAGKGLRIVPCTDGATQKKLLTLLIMVFTLRLLLLLLN